MIARADILSLAPLRYSNLLFRDCFTSGFFYYFFATLADEAKTTAGTLQDMQGFLDCYEGSKLKGSLVADGVYEKGAIKKTKFLEKAYKMGLKVK